MALQYPLRCRCSISVLKEESKLAGSVPLFKSLTSSKILSITSGFSHTMLEYPKLRKRTTKPKASKVVEEVSYGDGKEEDERTGKSDVGDDSDESHDSNANVKGKSNANDGDDGPLLMTNEERRELRRKIREVIDMNPDVEEEEDPIERRKKLEKLLSDYPLVVDEEDPNWPEDADGRGFNLSQFFNKITIKNVRKDDDDDYDSDKELVWQDDNYIKPIKDISTGEWEETVFKDISPLIILVHNRYKRLVSSFVSFTAASWNLFMRNYRTHDPRLSTIYKGFQFSKVGPCFYNQTVVMLCSTLDVPCPENLSDRKSLATNHRGVSLVECGSLLCFSFQLLSCCPKIERP